MTQLLTINVNVSEKHIMKTRDFLPCVEKQRQCETKKNKYKVGQMSHVVDDVVWVYNTSECSYGVW